MHPVPSPSDPQDLCRRLGIRYPIVQAPMAGGWTTPELAAAVTNAGGLGMLAATRLSPDQLAAQIDRTRELTDGPFGVNFLLAPPEPFDGRMEALQVILDAMRDDLGLPRGAPPVAGAPPSVEEMLALALDRDVRIISFAMGDPGPRVETAHASGATVLSAATTVEEARALEASGVDILVAQGAEAGGHRSTFRARRTDDLPLIGTLVLVPRIVDAVRAPVVASGGIMDARGFVAALALGAAGVQMGTRFLAARESGAFADYRRWLAEATDVETTITWHYTGRPARALRNRFLRELEGSIPLPWPFQALAAEDIYRHAIESGLGDYAPLLAGQGSGMTDVGASAAEIVAELVRDAEEIGAAITRYTTGGAEE